ncbi:putative receptor protein kinase ZmPK1 [Syzygium oleosum]|uniref:putative receptor protein kinase ZmPK1 n=1 Tax=Syzygium oleosum TaxID=219896 RepID=UPI0024BBB607|nr:putative receptor protein kinase ZmPK1 [Syzygium oleosum]
MTNLSILDAEPSTKCISLVLGEIHCTHLLLPSPMAPPPFSLLLPLFVFAFVFLQSCRLSTSALPSLAKSASLSVEKPADVLVSPSGAFSAGFFPVGDNAYSFAVWFSDPPCSGDDCTPVWMANRQAPVNGRRSTFSLLDSGNLVLTDAGHAGGEVWSSGTSSPSAAQLRLNDTGNLVLADDSGVVLWQSFDSPTDTLLPQQPLTRNTFLISARSRYNCSTGFYKLYFDNDNVLRLVFDGPSISSVYWPFPWAQSSQLGRFLYNSSRIAVLDPLGHFQSSDNYSLYTSDYGIAAMQRRMTLDFDGNLRVYSRKPGSTSWAVTWEAISGIPCFIHGVCGNNSLCSYDPAKGRSCSCVPGYVPMVPGDWSAGCVPDFTFSDACAADEIGFVKLLYVDFYGYDYNPISNTTLEKCRQTCLNLCNCRGFQYSGSGSSGTFDCYPKIELLNGHNLPSFTGEFFIKVPKNKTFTEDQLVKRSQYTCSPTAEVKVLNRTYAKKGKNGAVSFMLWFACVVGGIEIVVVFLVWFFLIRNQQDVTSAHQSYLLAATGFKRFTYDELKKATRNFSKEIGRGAGGIVYKALLPDDRVAAVKVLSDATTGEADFLAEASTIGRVNHMNLIEMWGYCAEGKHRLLVYEFMEHGSLAQNLSSPELHWKRRFDIAVGTAKGLAYLHEECLEWVLHCDVKPQNILLDSDYQPKVADFGLSKLMDRGKVTNSDFSRIRGTRGYMAPEWVSNLSITSKVDVYSYGIVMLEMVTGISPTTGAHSLESGGDAKQIRLVPWARNKMMEPGRTGSRLQEMVDPALKGDYDPKKMEILIEVALECVEEDKDARPTMSQVVEMLLRHENND